MTVARKLQNRLAVLMLPPEGKMEGGRKRVGHLRGEYDNLIDPFPVDYRCIAVPSGDSSNTVDFLLRKATSTRVSLRGL